MTKVEFNKITGVSFETVWVSDRAKALYLQYEELIRGVLECPLGRPTEMYSPQELERIKREHLDSVEPYAKAAAEIYAELYVFGLDIYL